jgi:hypothetical protein
MLVLECLEVVVALHILYSGGLALCTVRCLGGSLLAACLSQYHSGSNELGGLTPSRFRRCSCRARCSTCWTASSWSTRSSASPSSRCKTQLPACKSTSDCTPHRH